VHYGAPSKIQKMFWPEDAEEVGFWGAKDVNFEVRKGELLGVVGESGSGKSTIAKVLAGLQDFQGNLEIEGKTIGSRKVIDRAYSSIRMPRSIRARRSAGSSPGR